MSSRQPHTYNPPTVHEPRPTYSHIATYELPLTSSAKIITIAGQIGIAPDGTTAKTFDDQVRVALDNLSACLISVGATKRDLIKVTQYVVGPDIDSPFRGAIYSEWIGQHRPPSTLVGVARLASPELLYEIEAMAVFHGRRGDPTLA